MKYINADELIDEIIFNEEDGGIIGSKEAIDIIQNMPSADVVEIEPLKTYITNLISNIPQTDYVKDDYDAGFADALRIIYTHLCGADMRGETE